MKQELEQLKELKIELQDIAATITALKEDFYEFTKNINTEQEQEQE
jgi:hypothetical protein